MGGKQECMTTCTLKMCPPSLPVPLPPLLRWNQNDWTGRWQRTFFIPNKELSFCLCDLLKSWDSMPHPHFHVASLYALNIKKRKKRKRCSLLHKLQKPNVFIHHQEPLHSLKIKSIRQCKSKNRFWNVNHICNNITLFLDF